MIVHIWFLKLLLPFLLPIPEDSEAQVRSTSPSYGILFTPQLQNIKTVASYCVVRCLKYVYPGICMF